MRPALVFHCLLIFSLFTATNAFGLGLLIGAGMGLAKGLVTGTMGALGPIAKEGLGAWTDLFGNGVSGAGAAANQAISGTGALANQGLGSIQAILSSMLQTVMSVFQKILGSTGSFGSAIMGMFKSVFEGFFHTFGSLGGTAQGQISRMYLQTGKTFDSVMSLKLNPEKHEELIKQELIAAQEVLKTNFDHSDKLLAAFHQNAPQLTSAIKIAFERAAQEYQKHHEALHPEAKEGVQKMHLQVTTAKFGLESVLSPLASLMGSGKGMAKGGFSFVLNMIKNLLSMMTGLF